MNGQTKWVAGVVTTILLAAASFWASSLHSELRRINDKLERLADSNSAVTQTLAVTASRLSVLERIVDRMDEADRVNRRGGGGP
jgi:hypothetical protein